LVRIDDAGAWSVGTLILPGEADVAGGRAETRATIYGLFSGVGDAAAPAGTHLRHGFGRAVLLGCVLPSSALAVLVSLASTVVRRLVSRLRDVHEPTKQGQRRHQANQPTPIPMRRERPHYGIKRSRIYFGSNRSNGFTWLGDPVSPS
jgi:hypothetical protein